MKEITVEPRKPGTARLDETKLATLLMLSIGKAKAIKNKNTS